MIPVISDYYEPETFARIKAFADGQETPVLVVDTATVARQYQELVDAFSYARVFYAVKANPSPEILTLLRDWGACFDIASMEPQATRRPRLGERSEASGTRGVERSLHAVE